MVLALLHKISMVEIPVNYRPRVGTSKITGRLSRAVRVGLAMVGLIMRYRLTNWGMWQMRRRRASLITDGTPESVPLLGSERGSVEPLERAQSEQ